MRARVGFSPKTPQQEDGMRIDPPPSLAWAMGTIPEATAAADPPLEPPVVRSVFQADPTDGSLFLFINRRRDRLKMLYWDRDGLAIWYKRLESGTLESIGADGKATVEIDATQLAMLLGGVTLGSARRRKRYAVVG